MSYRKALILAFVISGVLLMIIIKSTSKDIPPYKYELKFVENPEVLIEMIEGDTLLSQKLHHNAKLGIMGYEDGLRECITECNKKRAEILQNDFYSTRNEADKLGISLNDYINRLCMESLKSYFQ